MASPNRALPKLDPFAVAPLFKWAANINTWWLLLLAPILLALALGATTIDGTLGTLEDFEPIEDAKTLLGIESMPESSPAFPFTRDIATWFLLSVIIATCLLVHRQWQIMAMTLPELVQNGALKVHDGPPLLGVSARIMFLSRVIERSRPENYLSRLVIQVQRYYISPMHKAAVVVMVVSLVLVLLLVAGQRKHGVFSVLAPMAAGTPGHAEWLDAAYQSWWAGDGNAIGWLLYIVVATFGLYVTLLQNIVGLACVYLIFSLRYTNQLDADWLNRDGRFGWTPIARIYRTVYWTVGIHGVTLSVLLVTLGIENFPWVLVLVCIWLILGPLYVFAPLFVFGRVETLARARRISMVERMMVSADVDVSDTFSAAARPYLDEIERVRLAKIRPLSMRRLEIPALILVAILPISLAAAQIFFSVRFGAQ